MKYDIAINNAIILTRNNGYQPFMGSVGITNEQITYVGTEKISGSTVIDATDKILMPGLINGHCHGDMTMARGLGEGMTLWEQNKEFSSHNWFKSYITDEDRYYSRQLTYIEALLNGTTFICENMYWDLDGKSVQAMSEIGIMGGLALDIRKDFQHPDKFIEDEVIKNFIEEAERYDLLPIIGSISEEDFHSELLSKIADKIEEFDILSTCHLAENEWRVDLVKERYHLTPIELMAKFGKLDKKTIGSHVVKITDNDITILKNRDFSIINTPICEMKIADGALRGVDLLEAGVNVGLGTDGALWNNSNDIFAEMKQTLLIQSARYGPNKITCKDVIDMATYNGAKAFGVEHRMGSIELGKLANIILIDISQPHLMPFNLHGIYENITTLVVTQATGRDVSDVIIKGRQVVKNNQLQHIEMGRIKQKVQEAHNKIISSLGRGFNSVE